jgi:hypothetical protein
MYPSPLSLSLKTLLDILFLGIWYLCYLDLKIYFLIYNHVNMLYDDTNLNLGKTIINPSNYYLIYNISLKFFKKL